MRMWGKRLVMAGVVAFVGAQVVPVARTNPPVNPAHTIFTSLPVPTAVVEILNRACEDCHSNQTAWPWYSRVAPVSWVTVHDVNEGRRELNLSEWGRYAPRRQDRKLKEICEQVESGSMPMAAYTLVHRQAALTPSDRRTLCEWAAEARKNAGAPPASASKP